MSAGPCHRPRQQGDFRARILSPITGGSGQISGSFTVEEATNLSILLRAGALPAKLTIVEERTVGPGLGQDSIDAGRRASIIAAILVVCYIWPLTERSGSLPTSRSPSMSS